MVPCRCLASPCLGVLPRCFYLCPFPVSLHLVLDITNPGDISSPPRLPPIPPTQHSSRKPFLNCSSDRAPPRYEMYRETEKNIFIRAIHELSSRYQNTGPVESESRGFQYETQRGETTLPGEQQACTCIFPDWYIIRIEFRRERSLLFFETITCMYPFLPNMCTARARGSH